ncbi:14745_t:CDS:2 [Rhizophagus irregularis]|uniref:Uncharacterized protein n=1 Tax=Rhizophagus irregularis (strain DAOM 181602 / DAOM 197198 / MUCL 43194) TaxID=747089 RepID=U9T7B9_RHIID|nr:14745_t:CDS:2 [Rhizophagus irregularis]
MAKKGLAVGHLAVWLQPKWPKKSWPWPNANTALKDYLGLNIIPVDLISINN